MAKDLLERNLLDVALEVLESDDSKISDIKPSDWAEKRRIMTSEVSSFVGPFMYERTPYLIEPVNCLMPSHPAKKIAVMKGAQIGFSTGVIENGIGWIMSEQPGPIYLLTGAQILSKVSVETKIDQMIQSCGLRHLLGPNVVKKRNTRTGDTSKIKEFAGGMLLTGETGNHKNIRQVAMRYGFIDDYEAAPPSTKQSGDTMDLIEQRFASYATKMKIFYISTPEGKKTSNIEPAFMMGDQRFWHVPCPCCGDHIHLQWKVQMDDKETAGMTWKTDNRGRLIAGSVGYICQSCGEFFTDGHKQEMNINGKWVPTAEPKEPGFYSYQISALYAPPGMYDWEHYVRKHLEARPEGGPVDVAKEKAFYNLCLGFPYDEKGESPNISRLSQNTRNYDIGTVPVLQSKADGNGEIVLVTMAADLNGTEDDARIDWEIVAWSESGSSYSIDHGSCGTFVPRENTLKVKKDRQKYSYEFYAKNSVWPLLMEHMSRKFPTDREDGSEMKVMITGIDCGYHSQYAYDFLDKAEQNGLWAMGLKGKNTEKFRAAGIDTKLYHVSKERDNLMLIEVNSIKDEMVPRMKMRWDERDGVDQPIEFINFPKPKDGKYIAKSFFSHWEAEEKTFRKNDLGQVIGTMWQKKSSASMNHFWDTRIYNEAMREIFSDMACTEMGIRNPNWRAYCNAVTGKD